VKAQRRGWGGRKAVQYLQKTKGGAIAFDENAIDTPVLLNTGSSDDVS
jgi:hypothetical protein